MMNLYSNIAHENILKDTINSIDDVIQLPKEHIYTLNHCPPKKQHTVLFNVMDKWLRILLLDYPPTIWQPRRLRNVGEVIQVLLKEITLTDNGVPKIELNNNLMGAMNLFVNWKAMHNLLNSLKKYNACKQGAIVCQTYFFFDLSLLTSQLILLIEQIRPIIDNKASANNTKILCNQLLDFFNQVIVLSTQKNIPQDPSTLPSDGQANFLFDKYLEANSELTNIGRRLLQQSNIVVGDLDKYLADLKKVFLEDIYPPLYRAWQDFRQNKNMDITGLQSLIRHGLTIYHKKICSGKKWSFIIKYSNDNHVVIINDDGISDKETHKPSPATIIDDQSATLHDKHALFILAALSLI